MKIKSAAELAGITEKNIRFYEEQGLITPERAGNGYREYSQTDIDLLLKIKLFRKLGIPIEEIKQMFDGTLNMNECLKRNLDRLEKEKDSLKKMQEVSSELIAQNLYMNSLKAEDFLDEIDRLERGGISFMAVEKTDIRRRKQKGAVGAAAVILFILACYVAICVWGMMTEPLPIAVAVLILGMAAVVAVGVVAALIGRMKEIKGGEEDEAAKY